MCRQMPNWSNKTVLIIIHPDIIYILRALYIAMKCIYTETTVAEGRAEEVKGKECGFWDIIFGGPTSSHLLWLQWKCTQQQKWSQSLLFGGCFRNLLYQMFTEDHVLLPAHLDTTCFCENVLNLWALSGSQRVMPLIQETLPKIHFKLFEVWSTFIYWNIVINYGLFSISAHNIFPEKSKMKRTSEFIWLNPLRSYSMTF